jgi:hypothetical protein
MMMRHRMRFSGSLTQLNKERSSWRVPLQAPVGDAMT